MQMCQPHWDAMRKAVDDRALTHLIASGGKEAARKLQQELGGGSGRDTFDPLMSMMFAIWGNVSEYLTRAGGDPLYLMGSGTEDPVTAPGYEGRTWPRCPLCYINLAHEMSCTNPKCELTKVNGYDWMIDRSADDALARARELKLIPQPS